MKHLLTSVRSGQHRAVSQEHFRWTLENAENATDLPIHAIREGEVPGIHEITYESDVDTISIKHDAKSRAGFALGAVIAAEFTAGKKGFLGMNDLFKF